MSQKIKAGTVVDVLGDEMTRIIWERYDYKASHIEFNVNLVFAGLASRIS